MGRRRLHNDGLPERVYPHKSGFIYRPAEGKARMLGKTVIDALAEYTRLTGQGTIVPAERAAPKMTIGDFVDHLVAKHLPTLSEDTQEQYLTYLTVIRAALGDLPPAALKPVDIYAFMDGVTESPALRNVILTQFRNIYKLAVRKGACEFNVAREVARDPTPNRDRAPTLAELETFKEAAGEWWACYIDFKLRSGLRQRDLIRLPPIPLEAETFTVEISKSKRWRRSEGRRTGVKVTYVVSEDLRAVLRRLYALERPASPEVLFCHAYGGKFARSSFTSAWSRVMRAAIASGHVTDRFHEHDIRATVGTLDPANAQDRLGHKHRTTTDLYLRKFEGKVVQPLAFKSAENAVNAPESLKNIHPQKTKKTREINRVGEVPGVMLQNASTAKIKKVSTT